MVLGAVHKPPDIYLRAEENPRKPQLGESLIKAVRPSCLKWGPFPPNEVDRIAQHVRKGEGGKEGQDKIMMVKPRCPWSHGGCGQKSFKLMGRCHQLLSGFLAKGHLLRVSRQSYRSLMIRVIMKGPRKTSARRSSDEGCATSHRLKWGR